jgi:hypothetical protein
MSSDPFIILGDLLAIVSGCVFAYAGYKAYSFRRALVGQVYRKRAFWTGTLAILTIPYGVLLIPLSYVFDLPFVGILLLVDYYVFVSVIGFFVLDSTIVVTRELDFFHRDTLHWKVVRKYAWVIFLFGAINIALPLGLLPNFVTSLIAIVVWPAPLAYFGIVLAVSSLRTKDRSIRAYAKWVGLFAAAFAIVFALPPEILFPSILGTVIGSFFFYRATMALSPLSRIVKEISQ